MRVGRSFDGVYAVSEPGSCRRTLRGPETAVERTRSPTAGITSGYFFTATDSPGRRWDKRARHFLPRIGR